MWARDRPRHSLFKRAVEDAALDLDHPVSTELSHDNITRSPGRASWFEACGWDCETGALKIDADGYDAVRQEWVREPKNTVPLLQDKYEEIRENLHINQDRDTGLVVIGIEHYSPLPAKQWVDLPVADLNSAVMAQEVQEAEQAIGYLTDQIDTTALADLRNIFFRTGFTAA